MKKTDINRYVSAAGTGGSKSGPDANAAAATAKTTLKVALKGILTALTILVITGIVVGISMFIYIMGLSGEGANRDLKAYKMKYTSFVYVNNAKDANAAPVEYTTLHDEVNRVWVNFDDIPKQMKDAIVAIEDKRFYDHQGVDWKRTVKAVTDLFTGSGSAGGSTLTQQLIKNLTEQNQVSITRKIKEIFSAINLEKKFSKDEILESYLNLVDFGAGCYGVQAAANTYFGKNIDQCDIAQCATIAGITQNPYAFNPLAHPEKNKERREIVLSEMYSQGKITKDQYDQAKQESDNMTFKTDNGTQQTNASGVKVNNWYIDTMFEDIVSDLKTQLGVGQSEAELMMYNGGLKIYSAMDTDFQKIAEDELTQGKKMMTDTDLLPAMQLNLGYMAMDYNGRVLAVLGSRQPKTANRLFNNVTDAKRQPGSTMKPIAAYGPAIDYGLINYSSIVSDEQIQVDNIDGKGRSGLFPNNWDFKYNERMLVPTALEQSRNCAATHVLQMVGLQHSYDFMTQKLHLSTLDPKRDVQLSPLVLGGMTYGVTVRDMCAAYQVFGNGGKYNKPYTYFYVLDHDGNVILDNREGKTKTPSEQAIKSTTASIMYQLLRMPIYGAHGTGGGAQISNWQVYGKTGTTNDNKDSYFIGGTPYAVAAIWTGYDIPKTIPNTSYAIKIWQEIMSNYLKTKPAKMFTLDQNVVSRSFCVHTGLLANPAVDSDVSTGWYDKNNIPPMCNGVHDDTSSGASSASVSSAVSSVPVSSQPPVSSTSHESSSQAQSSSKPASSVPSSSSKAASSASSPSSHAGSSSSQAAG